MATELDFSSGNPTDRMFLSILIFAGLFILYRRDINWSEIFKNNTLIFILFLYMALSIMWSDFMFISFKRWIKLAGNLIMAFVVLTEPDLVEAVKRLIRRCAYVLIPLSLIFIKYYRHIGVAYTQDGSATMWVGVTTHKNSLGQLCFVVSFFLLWSLVTKWRERKRGFLDKNTLIEITLLLMTFWILNGSTTSQSKTSIIALIIGICVFIGLSTIKNSLKHLGIYVFLIVLIGLSLQMLSGLLLNDSLLSTLITSSGRNVTLTGRVPLWEELMRIGSQHPLFGAGFASFWMGDVTNRLWDIFVWKPESAHNGYLDAYLSTGIAGLSLLIAAIWSAYRNICRTLLSNFDYGRWQMSLLVMIIVYNFAESTFLKGTSLLWFVFLLIAVDISQGSLANNKNKGL